MATVYIDKKHYKNILVDARKNSKLNQSIQKYDSGEVVYYDVRNDYLKLAYRMVDGTLWKCTMYPDGKIEVVDD